MENVDGIQVWPASFCRSTLAFYDALGEALNLPLRVCITNFDNRARAELGFSVEEFAHLDFVSTSDAQEASGALVDRPNSLQIFGSYHTRSTMQATLVRAIQREMCVGIASEAPCNMEPPGVLRHLKDIYLKFALPIRVSQVTAGARFILNWSGDDSTSLQRLGWSAEKIIPLGYFPPPLPGTNFRHRKYLESKPFRILCSGSLTWHRGADTLIEALLLLQSWGVPFEADLTGTGPLEAALRLRVDEARLPVKFLGRVPLGDLVALYQDCSVFVAPGRQEPWGIRVNDALNAGAPTIVSRGMGASKLVHDLDVGSTFAAGDAVDLASKLRSLIEDGILYQNRANALLASQSSLLPKVQAEYAARRISEIFASSPKTTVI